VVPEIEKTAGLGAPAKKLTKEYVTGHDAAVNERVKLGIVSTKAG
jgi:hypothetical protein